MDPRRSIPRTDELLLLADGPLHLSQPTLKAKARAAQDLSLIHISEPTRRS